ncbi:ferredoxin--NADP reductase [Shewanella gelidii]|uniref:ferredoxin--NADP(+) reductase n=1 Tax=Shewanella gelidii TaxID=1642821 RepID=A0A917JUU6_9GAMM|nr:ferredoxin--NADP reductase [Shewanella gelidii]MCL1098833.1 ferredoxin--NADP reductase [Shewanella gelidii]GGI87334.1 ferredoxin--NADP(+) reductase [Shewanella gelidii]
MWVTGKVIERIDWNDKLFSLKIAADVAPFIAGQFIKLSQVRDDKRVARAYSLVNGPDTDYVEILAVAVEDGMLSPDLQALKPGDEIEVSQKATGFMTLDEIPEQDNKHMWFLATGTAVGPFISMMQTSALWQRFEKVVLVYGVRYIEDLAYLELLKDFKLRYPEQFQLVTCVTREENSTGLNCRIPDGIDSGEISKYAGLEINAEQSQVMICGNPGMIQDSVAALRQIGLEKNLRRAPGQITVEKYW